MKEFKSFEELNKEAAKILSKCKILFINKNESEQVVLLRRNINKDTLLSFIEIATLSKEVQMLLGSNTRIVKFSLDNYLKNRIIHPEVTLNDYLKIPIITNKPSKVLKSKNGYDVILFKEDEKYYKLVVKTTAAKNENFVKSLHLLNYDRYLKY